MPQKNQTRRVSRWPFPRVLALGALAVGLAGCDTDSLLEVEDPEFATPETLTGTSAIPTIFAGAVGDFQVSYSGASGDALLSSVASFTDEFYSSDTFTTRTAMDQRDLFPSAQGNVSDGTFAGLQRARRALKDAAEAVAGIAASDARIPELRALEGYTYVALAENFCSGIPFSDVVDGQRVEGPGLATAQVFEAALARFDAALAASPNNNLAKVGKARALLGLNRAADAAAAVTGVPQTFVYFVEHSANSTRQSNPIFSLQNNGRYSVSDDEGGPGTPSDTISSTAGEGLEFRLERDPRVPFRGPVAGFDATIDQYISLRYTGFGSDVPLATGVEAQLIRAEAALKANQTTEFLNLLNALRADVQPLMARLFPDATYPAGFPRTLAPLTDPGTPEARVDLLFHERAFWLYLTGQRLGDLRRLVRQYGRAQQNVFPSGPYFKGGVYGTDVSFPIPFDEANNSQYDPSTCNTKQA